MCVAISNEKKLFEIKKLLNEAYVLLQSIEIQNNQGAYYYMQFSNSLIDAIEYRELLEKQLIDCIKEIENKPIISVTCKNCKYKKMLVDVYELFRKDYPKQYVCNKKEQLSIQKIKNLVAKQAEDSGLWFEAQIASESYLQQELRKLHAVIEDEFGAT